MTKWKFTKNPPKQTGMQNKRVYFFRKMKFVWSYVLLYFYSSPSIRLQSVRKIVGQNVPGCQSMYSFLFFFLPCFCNIDLGGRGDLKLLPLILWTFSELSTIFFNWLFENYGEKSSNLKSPNVFSKPVRKTDTVRSHVYIYEVALINSTIP